MRKVRLILLLIVVLSLFQDTTAQTKSKKELRIDSLRLAYKNAGTDSDKLSSLKWLCRITKYSDFNNSEIYGEKGIILAKKLDDISSEADIHNNLGLAYTEQISIQKALKHYFLAEKLFKSVKNDEMVGVVYNNLGLLYNQQHDYAKELTYHHKALDIFEKNKLQSRKAMSYINIGRVYVNTKDFKTSASYFIKSYKIYDKLNEHKRVVTCLNNIAAIYTYAEDYKLASFYFDKNLELLETLENVDRKKSMVLYNSSGALIYLKKYDLAEERLTEALAICKEYQNKESLAICYHNFGNLYTGKKEYDLAEEYYFKSLAISLKMQAKDIEMANHEKLSKLYDQKEEYKEAYLNYKKFSDIKDTLFNAQIESINEVEKKYTAEKSARALEAVNIEKEREEHQSNIIKIAGVAVILILFMVIASVFIKYRDKKKSNLLLAEKNKEITDSITYAKRIQSAILPPEKIMKTHLRDSFVLYKPKDIVAGDFYWLEHRDDKVLFAAADCTGHGVPGAMVSVVCNNALNRSVREHGLTDPGKILDTTREIVVQEFEKSDEDVKDGMDIALCSIDGNILKYAGAHNPLWILRGGEVLETRADKEPIGQFDNPKPYTTHTFELQKGDSIYIFSDGYVDQFGGKKGKKFKARAFRELLLSIQDKTMEEQRVLIDKSFENWRGEEEQVDDVCVIGVRV